MKKPESNTIKYVFLIVLAIIHSCKLENTVESTKENNKIYIVPLNEKYINLKNKKSIDFKDYNTIIKDNILSDSLDESSEIIISNITNSIDEKEIVIEKLFLKKYGLLDSCKKIDITESYGYMNENDLMKYIFTKSYIYNINKLEIIKNSNRNYYLIGNDFIRFMSDEIENSQGNAGLKLFFRKYDAWPYMLIVDKRLYSQLRPGLLIKYNKSKKNIEKD
ncbi:hypothetical protein J7E24_06345 [Hymenobacter sp. ISL-91]|uniref:hypothetical protein n=1 Tax=Hymenobacter sp. ISL-91 TaxID=2819151 RepID=UPI001BECBF39|nr:hypothetical protein [Hymenobacter sp. ISL-91]MBT2557398.1 hypothetical protein [Hymenobacter sp. ISL-91]